MAHDVHEGTGEEPVLTVVASGALGVPVVSIVALKANTVNVLLAMTTLWLTTVSGTRALAEVVAMPIVVVGAVVSSASFAAVRAAVCSIGLGRGVVG